MSIGIMGKWKMENGKWKIENRKMKNSKIPLNKIKSKMSKKKTAGKIQARTALSEHVVNRVFLGVYLV